MLLWFLFDFEEDEVEVVAVVSFDVGLLVDDGVEHSLEAFCNAVAT